MPRELPCRSGSIILLLNLTLIPPIAVQPLINWKRLRLPLRMIKTVPGLKCGYYREQENRIKKKGVGTHLFFCFSKK